MREQNRTKLKRIQTQDSISTTLKAVIYTCFIIMEFLPQSPSNSLRKVSILVAKSSPSIKKILVHEAFNKAVTI